MTSSSASSSSPMRWSRQTSSCCRRSRSLGLVTAPESSRCWSRTAAGLDLLDVVVGLALGPGEVVDLDLEVAARPSRRCALAGQLRAAPRPSGGCAAWWRSASRRLSSSWTSSSLSWADGSAFRRVVLLGPGQARKVHGSVTRVLTWVSTVSPRLGRCRGPPSGHHRQPGPLRGPVRDVDERGAAVLEELAGPVVLEVGGHDDVGAGARRAARAATPPTRRRPRRCGPAARVPRHAYAVRGPGQRPGDPLGEGPQRHRLRQLPDPAVAAGGGPDGSGHGPPGSASSTRSKAGSS